MIKMANINVRVSDKEARKLKALAKLNGVSLSDYIRGILAEQERQVSSGISAKNDNNEIVKLRIQQKKLEDAVQQLAEIFANQMEETQTWIRTTLLLATTKENVVEAYKQAKGGG